MKIQHINIIYYLKTEDTIEDDIYDCLKNKSDFSERNWAKRLDNRKEDGL